MFYWWTQSERKIRWLAIAVAVLLAVLPVIPDQYIERFQSIGGQEAEGHSKETRMVILQDAMQIFMNNPGGVGVASFPAVRQRVFGCSQDTHNLYLEVATNLGVQGLAVFVFLIVAMLNALKLAVRRFRRQERELARAIRRHRPDRGLARLVRGHLDDLAFLGAVVRATAGFIWVRLALGLFGMDLYEVYWWFAAGIAFSVVQLAESSRLKSRALAELVRESTV